MKKLLSMFLVVALIFSLTACGSEEAEEDQGATTSGETEQTEETTNEQDQEMTEKKDLKLTVYAGLQEDHAALAIKEFEKATGVKTEMVRMSGGEIFARIKAEKDNPSASIWYGGGALTFMAADK